MSRAAEFCKIAVDDDGRLSALICRKLNMRLPVERIAGSLGFLLGGKLAGGVLFSDLRPGCGPLGALESVLSAMRSDAALCVACDLPFFTRELGQAMLRAFREGADCLICRDETGRVHPVCAIYHRRALPVVTGQLQVGDFRMMHLLANLKTDYFPVTAAQMQNANTPEIWSEIQKNEHA